MDYNAGMNGQATMHEALLTRKRKCIAVIAMLCLIGAFFLLPIRGIVWSGYFSFNVQVVPAKPICWMNAVSLSQNFGPEEIGYVLSPEELVEQFTKIGWFNRTIDNQAEDPIRVDVKVGGHVKSLFGWQYEVDYGRQKYFALYGLFEDGEYFAKIVHTPKERDFRGTVVVELP